MVLPNDVNFTFSSSRMEPNVSLIIVNLENTRTIFLSHGDKAIILKEYTSYDFYYRLHPLYK